MQGAILGEIIVVPGEQSCTRFLIRKGGANMTIRPTSLTAAAGEYYVALELSARGYSVGIPRANTPGVDLLVANQAGTKVLSIQVKTSNSARRDRKNGPSDSYWEWGVGQRAMTLRGENLFYAFVDLRWGSRERPLVFIVPSNVVAGAMTPNSSRYMFYISDADTNRYQEKWEEIEKHLSG